MKKAITLFFVTFLATVVVFGQQSKLEKQIDSLILHDSTKPFNGVVLIYQGDEIVYSKAHGFADFVRKYPLQMNSQFVIGSVSKQFTAVLVLQEYENGRLKLEDPIGKYLPELRQPWADTVTIHDLLTHMHGIYALDKPTAFRTGTAFSYAYSSLGYDLLAKIVEKTSGKSFVEISENLFDKCGMKNTFHPQSNKHNNLVKGYYEDTDGNIIFDDESFKHPVAAGAFIATAEDLMVWNSEVFSGKLLKKETMNLLLTKHKGAVRNHPIFGFTEYGYGYTIDTSNGIMQCGQTGYAPGFVSMNFYFPGSETGVVVLENVTYDLDDLKKTFSYHTEILNMVRADQVSE